ncbi:hypothetical protein [Bdellovibrio bacteriovorus]|uniref:hypothetical protein n=1 Tax=Bdellovibrio bacteriovorus TaxID=959 RepID=UPI003AA9AC90
MLTKALKLKVCARAFYQDAEEGVYEDFRAAEVEFMAKPPPDRFIDFVAGNFIAPVAGHKVFVSSDGHVARVRMSDGYFEPVTEMTEDEGETFEAKFMELLDSDVTLEPLDALKKMGWVEV